jgi:hypothetical protein
MIFRILCEERNDNPFFLDIWERANEPNVCRRRLMGAYAAGAIGGEHCLGRTSGTGEPVSISPKRAGTRSARAILTDTRRRGTMIRVIRLKDPPLSQTI